MKRNLVLSIAGLLFITVLAGMYVYHEYNRRNPSVAELSADVSLQATALIDAFTKDSAAANMAYLGKVVEITGFVKSVDKDASGGYTLSLGDPDSLSSVRCSMTTTDTTSLTSQKMAGTTVVLKGICTGFMPDDMGLGADVIVNRSVIETKSSQKN
ncbi:MAG: hypothetical protein KGO92_11065 [Bacteroidota bacterium]|nr:hypothetical protein [Bacteroidota bacterium]